MKWSLLVLLLGCLLATGCATVPFSAEPRADFRNADSQTVTTEFGAAVGTRFELLESVVFRFFGRELTGMGYLSINDQDGSYALACMTPTGVKILEFRGTGETVETLFLPPPLEAVGTTFSESVARDIRRIYFGWVPHAEATPTCKRDRLVFNGDTPDGKVRHTYAGPRGVLTQKRFSKGWRTRCQIDYFDFREIQGKLYPHGILLHNKQLHYKLVVRVKMVLPTTSQLAVDDGHPEEGL